MQLIFIKLKNTNILKGGLFIWNILTFGFLKFQLYNYEHSR